MKIHKFAMIVLIPAMMAAGPRDEAITGDLARLQGQWVTSAGPKRDIAVAMEIRGRAVAVDITMPRGLKIHAEGEMKVDEKASPKAIDWVGFTALEGQEMPEVLAIYELEGNTLKLANGGPNNPRPKQFRAGDGVLADVVTLTRPKVAARAEGEKAKSSMAMGGTSR